MDFLSPIFFPVQVLHTMIATYLWRARVSVCLCVCLCIENERESLFSLYLIFLVVMLSLSLSLPPPPPFFLILVIQLRFSRREIKKDVCDAGNVTTMAGRYQIASDGWPVSVAGCEIKRWQVFYRLLLLRLPFVSFWFLIQLRICFSLFVIVGIDSRSSTVYCVDI